MKPKLLSHKDLVNLAVHKLNKGFKLNKVEKDLHDMGIERKDALKAIEEADYYVQKEKELKARQEAEASKKQQAQAEEKKETAQTQQTKYSFWIYFFVLLVLVGLAVFYYLYNNKF